MSKPGSVQAGAIPPRAVIAVILGNWLEFYDFIVFTFFAVMIGHAFFPVELMAKGLSKDEAEFLSLLASLATFWAGFLTRPIGAAVIGAYADRAGRKAAMTLTILLMALGTGMLALTPSYAEIGIAAPLLVLAARLIQGFSCGGEVGPATTYLLEAAPPNQRAALTSWQGISQQFAGVMGSGFGLILAALLSKEDLYEWGWRMPFAVGILIAPVGFYIRSVLPETMDKHEAHESSLAVLKHLFAHHTPAVVLTVLCIVGPTISTYVSGYMTTYAIRTLHLPEDVGHADDDVRLHRVDRRDSDRGLVRRSHRREDLDPRAAHPFHARRLSGLCGDDGGGVDGRDALAHEHGSEFPAGAGQRRALCGVDAGLPEIGALERAVDRLRDLGHGVRRLDAVRHHVADQDASAIRWCRPGIRSAPISFRWSRCSLSLCRARRRRPSARRRQRKADRNAVLTVSHLLRSFVKPAFMAVC